VPPRKGRRHVLRVVREILYHEPEGRGTDIAGALDYLGRLVRRRAVVFLVSDFLAEAYESSLRITNRVHDLVALVVQDPRESEIPDVGLIALEDAETGQVRVADTMPSGLRARFREAAAERLAARQSLFRRLSIDSVELATDRPYDVPLIRFFQERARHAR